MSKAKSAKDLLERMKTVAVRRGATPRGTEAAPAEPPGPAAPPPERGKKVRITVDLDPEMHRFLKVYAAERGMKLSEVVRELINRLKEEGGS